jgi:hypothetical protein
VTDNPLKKYYRTKEVYVKLPTNYKFFSTKPATSEENEIGIMPMSTRDEMLIKIPDSLYNGEALYEIIESIAPDIKNPYELCIPDLDVILLATRIASYGKNMDIEAVCPNCKKYSIYSIDIPVVLSKLKMLPEDYTIEVKGLSITFKPNSVSTINAKRIAQLETQKIANELRGINDSELPKIKEKLKKSLEVSTAARYAIIADAIEKIELPDGSIVTEIEHILDWLSNSDSATISILEKNKNIMNDNGIQKTFDVTCSNEDCNEKFTAPLEFNPAFFFRTK